MREDGAYTPLYTRVHSQGEPCNQGMLSKVCENISVYKLYVKFMKCKIPLKKSSTYKVGIRFKS